MKQFTATVYILKQNHVLLIYHKKLQKWLPPGGHVEPHELPSEAAIREAKEETGLAVELIPQENIWINERWNGKSFERPYMCLLEEIPPFKNEPAHQHVDFIYVGRPLTTVVSANLSETGGVRWFSLQELESLEKDIEIFEETYLVIKHLLTQHKELPFDQAFARV